MPAKNPRVNTVLEPPLRRALAALARKDGVSLSQKVRDLLRDAIETLEDQALDELVRKRRAVNRRPRWVPHAEAARRLS